MINLKDNNSKRSHQPGGASDRVLTVLKRPTGDRIGQAKCHNTVFGVVAATVQSPCALLRVHT